MLFTKSKFRIFSVLVILAMLFSFAGFSSAHAVLLPKVAVYAADLNYYGSYWIDDVVTKLTATGLFSQVDNLSPLGCGADSTPTLAALQQYDAVMIWSDCSFNDPAALGNVLADYVDGGGHVVVSTFAFYNSIGLQIEGRFASGGYLPLTQGSAYSGTRMFLVSDLLGDPLLASVSTFDGGSRSYHDNPVSLATGATLVAHWTNGQPLVAYKGNVVALNFFPPSSDSRGDFWNSATDGARLMANALGATALNQPPTADAGGPYSGYEGTPISLSSASASDPDGDSLTSSWSVDSALCSFDDADALNPDLTCSDNGSYTATLTVDDGVNPAVSSDAAVTVNNVAPTASLGNNGPIDEGGSATVSFSGAFDPSSADTSAGFHYAFDCNGGSLSAATYAGSGASDSASCAFADNGNYTVSGMIMDKDDGATEYTTTVMVNNVAPTLGAISLDQSPVAVNTTFTASASFTDPGTLDTHTAVWDWGDGTTVGTVTQGAGSGSVDDSHSYSTPGIYTIKLIVTDKDGADSNESVYQQLFVYAFAPGGGAFVVGDQTATGSVMFWGAKWAKLNSLSGGDAPSAFKGFAQTPSDPACGVSWSTSPSNSAPPPDGPLPSYMAVIVTSSSTKSGSTISGDTVSIVVVQTDSGYESNSGHAGTGTVVATICP